jgi:D-alanine-D-alanine ligase
MNDTNESLKGKRIAVLMGGPGSERLVSMASGKGVMEALITLGADAYAVDVQGDGFELKEGTDFAFNVIHGTYGEDGGVQAELERRGVRYTGEGVDGSKTAIDKIRSKECFVRHGVPTPGFEVIAAGARPSMGLPLVLKAPKEGSSVGVYIVHEAGELESALVEVARYSQTVLVERFVEGRELTVGILGDEALPVIEIRARKDFYNFENKYPFLNPKAAGADHLCPAPLSPECEVRVKEIAVKAHRALGLRVYSRVDLLLTEAGSVYVLEVNTIPGMTPSSLLPEAASEVGISYAQLCRTVIDLSLSRKP